ncbi:MAG: glycosyltransferase family 4 protein, partial [bacterium]
MRIVIFSQYFPPELGACANRIELFAKGLAKKGCDVTVVAGMPNYPFGKIFDGYKGKLFKRENYNGVEVFRAWVFPSRRKNLLGRALNYLSYFFSALIISLFLRKADVIIASIQPFTVGFVGLFFRFVKGGKLVVDVRDIVEEGSELFQWKSISRGAPKLEKSLLKRANLIITVTSKLVEYIKGYLNDKRNVYLVENSVDLDMIMKSSTSIDRAQFGWEGKFVLIYAGNIGYRHNVGFIIDVAREAQRKGVEELLFLIIGDGVE